jgi:hypothetical protein
MIKTLLAVLITFCSISATAFDLPESDPFYYQSNSKGLTFTVPDKAQHYYGSQLLSKLGDHLSFLPGREVTAPLLAFGIGFLWEVYQANRGIGFSERDLLADALGVLASKANRGNTVMYLNYSTADRTIILNLGVKL